MVSQDSSAILNAVGYVMTQCALPFVSSIAQNPYAKMSLVMIQAAPAKALVTCMLLIVSLSTPVAPPAT